MHLATRAEAAGEDEHVATRGLVDRRARPNLEAIARADRRLGESDCLDSEWRGSGAKAGDTEHLERPGKVQDFDIVEDEDLYMTWRARCHRGFGCGLHVSDLRSWLALSEANACAKAQHDEMCGALERRDAHFPALQIDDAAGCEIACAPAVDVLHAQVELSSRRAADDRDTDAAAADPYQCSVGLIRTPGDDEAIIDSLDVALRNECLHADASIDIRTDWARRPSELRTDGHGKDVVRRARSDLHAIADGLAEGGALRLIAILHRGDVGAKTQNAMRVQAEQVRAAHSITET